MLYKNYEKKYSKTGKSSSAVQNSISANTNSYRQVTEAAESYFQKDSYNRKFYVSKKIGMVNYTYEISRTDGYYAVRQKENLLADTGSLSTALTRLFEELRGY